MKSKLLFVLLLAAAGVQASGEGPFAAAPSTPARKLALGEAPLATPPGYRTPCNQIAAALPLSPALREARAQARGEARVARQAELALKEALEAPEPRDPAQPPADDAADAHGIVKPLVFPDNVPDAGEHRRRPLAQRAGDGDARYQRLKRLRENQAVDPLLGKSPSGFAGSKKPRLNLGKRD